MSFNSKLRKAVYGSGAGATNPLLNLPAGFTGTTWRGTGFELPPTEPVELDRDALPWELQEESTLAPPAPEAEPQPRSGLLGGISALGILLFAVAAALVFIGA